jgi:TRAP-type C4-dicarboxylate transport system permease small subunit
MASIKIQVMDTIAALMTAAFGLIAALAWNTAIADAVHQYFSKPGDQLMGEFVYAIIVTILAVVAILLIARAIAKLKNVELIASDKKKDEAK